MFCLFTIYEGVPTSELLTEEVGLDGPDAEGGDASDGFTKLGPEGFAALRQFCELDGPSSLPAGGEKLSFRQRIERTRAWLHQRDNEKRMQALRKETRAKEMAERRKERVKEKEREKTIQEMQMLSKVRTKIDTGDLGDVEVEKKGILSRVKKGKKGKDRGASGTALMPIGDGAKNEYAQLSEGDEPKT